MKKITTVVLLFAFVAPPALADNTGKAYVAGDLGSASYSNVTVPAGGGYPAGTFPNPAMVRIAGGYHFSPIFAAEIGYSKFGDTQLDYAGVGIATLSMNSFQVAAVGTFPVSPQFDLIGKLGLSRNTVNLTGTGGFSSINNSSSQTDLLVGAGMQYNLNSQVSIRAQYDSFGKFTNDSQPITASAISVGVAYNF
jgi:OOP family OmpA-OmpF porin